MQDYRSSNMTQVFQDGDCAICQRATEKTILFPARMEYGAILRCRECNTCFVHPQPTPEQIDAYYNGMYADLAAAFDQQKYDWARRSMKGYVRELSRLGIWPRKDMLDFGGGLGYYSKAASEQGVEVSLVDPDPVSVNFARDTLKIQNTSLMGLETFSQQLGGQQWDWIFARHVIEHQPNPREMLQVLNSALTKGGVLVIETDNNRGVEILFRPGLRRFYQDLYKEKYGISSFWRLLRARPFAVDPPRHLWGFNRNSLETLLRETGFTVVKYVPYLTGDAVYWPNLPYPSAVRIAKDTVRLRFDSLNDCVTYPLKWALRRLDMSSGMCLYCVKT